MPEAAAGAIGKATRLVRVTSGHKGAPLHAVRMKLGGGVHLITGRHLNVICALFPCLLSHWCTMPVTLSSQRSECPCTEGISGPLHELT